MMSKPKRAPAPAQPTGGATSLTSLAEADNKEFVGLENTFYRPGEIVDGQQRNDRHHYFGGLDGGGPGPQVFRVDMRANRTNPAHFHSVDQFQAFFGRPGARYRRTPIGPLMVHYSDSHRTYGPFSAGAETFHLLTLRPHHNMFTGVMPQDRDKVEHRDRRRSIHSDVTLGEAPDAGEAIVDSVIERHQDGLEALILRAGPRTRTTTPGARDSSGQFCVVVSGEVVTSNGVWGPQAIRWSGPGSAAMEASTGEGVGFEMLVLQLPDPADS